MPHVCRTSVEATNHKAPGSPAVQVGTSSSAPPEPHPPVGEPHPSAGEPAHTEDVHTEADMPHADVVSGPLPGTHLPMTMIPLHHHPYRSSFPLSLSTSLRRALCDIFSLCTIGSRLPPSPNSVRPMRHIYITFQKATNQ